MQLFFGTIHPGTVLCLMPCALMFIGDQLHYLWIWTFGISTKVLILFYRLESKIFCFLGTIIYSQQPQLRLYLWSWVLGELGFRQSGLTKSRESMVRSLNKPYTLFPLADCFAVPLGTQWEFPMIYSHSFFFPLLFDSVLISVKQNNSDEYHDN